MAQPPPDASFEGSYRFGPFLLDPRHRILTRVGIPIILTPTLMEVLIQLVANPGKVVTKNQLLDQVWPERIVEESNVRRAISTLRRALGPDGDRMILTVPGRGYRFAEHVQLDSAEQDDALLVPVTPTARRTLLRRPPIWLAACFLGALFAVGILAWHAHGPPPQGRKLVLADFENRTGNPIFDRTLANLLRVDIGQSPYITLVSERQDQQILSDMRRPPDSPVTPAAAEEICVRANADTVLQGGIAALGARYVLTLTATDCSGAQIITAEKEEVVGRDAVAPAIDRLIALVRAKLGEPGRSIRNFNVPLVGAQTASLDALKAYSEGKWLFDHGRNADAIPLELHAIELDPRFAAAYANLGVIYAALYDQSKTSEFLTKAYALRDTANEHSKLQTVALYDQFVTRDYDEAIRNFKLWTEIYSQDAIAWSNLANAEDYIGKHDQAIADGRRAVALKPVVEVPYVVLARAELEAGRVDEARATADIAVSLGIAADSTHRELLRIADMRNDARAIAIEERWASTATAPRRTQEIEAEIALSHGRVGAAKAIFDKISEENRERGTLDHVRPVEAGLLAALGLQRDAAGLLPPIDLKAAPDPDYLLALAAVGNVDRADRLVREWLAQSPSDTLLHQVFAPQAEAFIALRRGDPKAAVAALRPALAFQARGLDVPYQSGMTFLAAGDATSAERAFRTVLAHRGWAPESPLYPLATLGLARALRVEGNLPASAAAYRSFLGGWKTADPDIPVLLAARAEYMRLGTR